MASIKMRSASIIFIFICAIFIMQMVLLAADQGGSFRTERYDPRAPPTPQGNPRHGMNPPDSPPPIYT
ncbi:unnamed protein product [Lactuca virosa]|uniref:Uncharacterized protein n=1 Tax=Lactuca virosa TaxID=75947 RepID=A0AAU9LJ49_9ASTR|nr:unnamed protein product [Lactuca virosa]